MKMKRRRKMKHDIDLRSSLDLRKYLESSRGFGQSRERKLSEKVAGTIHR